MTNEPEFQKIYETYKPKIFRYLTRLTNEHEAEDLAQEVFMKVSQGLKDFRGEAHLSTWIYRIATNVALDRLRSPSFQGSLNIVSLGEVESEIGDKDALADTKSMSQDLRLIRKEMNECIRNIIKTLPEDYKTVIVLGELEELKNHEIAEILQVSLDTVKIRLHRARAKLRKELETHCSFYRDERNVFSCDLKSAIKTLRETP